MINNIKNTLWYLIIKLFILSNLGRILLCFVFSIILSKISNNTGKIVSVHITPSNTPLAITSPKSLPNVNVIVHRTRKPAIVVRELPATEVNVSSMALLIASSLVLYWFFLFSYEWYKKIEKSVVTPSWSTATKALVI